MPHIPYLDAVVAHPWVALAAGALLLLLPRLFAFAAAAFLILIGCLQIWPHLLSQIP